MAYSQIYQIMLLSVGTPTILGLPTRKSDAPIHLRPNRTYIIFSSNHVHTSRFLLHFFFSEFYESKRYSRPSETFQYKYHVLLSVGT